MDALIIEENVQSTTYFQVIDYIFFIIMLIVSASIGIYFGYFDGKEKTTDEYLLGGRAMKTVPIAISLIASQLSAFSILTLPAEGYAFGTNYMFMILPMIVLLTIIICYVTLPVFYENNIDNCYAYLELRFSKNVRNIISSTFLVSVLFKLPIASFLPALAFSQATGHNIHIVNGIVSTICVGYTMIGGVKAVVWTDVVQAFVMFVSVIVLFVYAVINVGGFDIIWNRGVEGQRIVNFDYSLDFQTRQTFWNLFLGSFCTWLSFLGLNQSCVQRIVSLPSLQHARRALLVFCIGVIIIFGLNCSLGIIMYAYYYNCDPVKAGVVDKNDKMIPYFVNDIVGHISGMPGLFISSVFSASLSTVSAYLNCMAGVFYKDFVCNIKGFKHTEKRANFTMKLTIILVGIFCVLMGFVVETSTSLYQTLSTIMSLTHGITCGVFLLGFLCPRANHKAVLWAIIISMTVVVWIVIGGQIYKNQINFSYKPLPTNVDECDLHNIMVINRNSTLNTNKLPENLDFISSLYLMSFLWYSFVGTSLVGIIGVPLSYLMKAEKNVNPKLISPVARFLLPKEYRQMQMKSNETKLIKENQLSINNSGEFKDDDNDDEKTTELKYYATR